MRMMDKIKNFFGQLGAEAGVAQPQADTPVDEVTIHSTDMPEPPRHDFADGPLAPEMPEHPERSH